MNKALDSFQNYASHISKKGNIIQIQRQNTYQVDISIPSCTCEDFQRHSHETPCKHIFLAIMWQNSKNNDREAK